MVPEGHHARRERLAVDVREKEVSLGVGRRESARAVQAHVTSGLAELRDGPEGDRYPLERRLERPDDADRGWPPRRVALRIEGREIRRGNRLREDVVGTRISRREDRLEVRRHEELRHPLPVGLVDLGQPVEGVRVRRLVALAEVEDLRRAARADRRDDRGKPRRDVDVGLRQRPFVEDRDLVHGNAHGEPGVAAVARHEEDVVAARREALGVLDDDLDAARELERLEDPDDSHGEARRAGIALQVAGRCMSPLRHVSDSTWNVRSLRASKSARAFSSAR